MKIRITDENREAIIEAFKEANGKASANALHGDHAFLIARRAEARLEELGTPKGKRKGTRATFTPSGPPKSYRYPMRTTTFTIERGASDWFLVIVFPVSVWPRAVGGMTLSITPATADLITAAALKPTNGIAEKIEKDAARAVAGIEADARRALRNLEHDKARRVREALKDFHIQSAA